MKNPCFQTVCPHVRAWMHSLLPCSMFPCHIPLHPTLPYPSAPQHGVLPLQLALKVKNSHEVVRVLLEAGADQHIPGLVSLGGSACHDNGLGLHGGIDWLRQACDG